MKDWAILSAQVTPLYYHIAITLLVILLAWLGKTTLIVFLAAMVIGVELAEQSEIVWLSCLIISLIAACIISYAYKIPYYASFILFFTLLFFCWEFKRYMVWDFKDSLAMILG